ncbi:MAG: hypothetical protein JHC52_05720 [Chthoniobacterales bacterium]|nr:hypothetical protein [Chthoniobacterales bacterium]MBJ7390033.1 hypothetical protein [Chthoniobacterales bacterium]
MTKKSTLPLLIVTASLVAGGCTKNYYYTAPVRTRTESAPAKKAPANYSPAVDGFQAVTKPTSYSSY